MTDVALNAPEWQKGHEFLMSALRWLQGTRIDRFAKHFPAFAIFGTVSQKLGGCPLRRTDRPSTAMSHNTIGHIFRVTTWGESHGPSIGGVIDGCPPGIALAAEDIQTFLDKR